MSNPLRRLSGIIQVLSETKPDQLFNFALYQLLLRSGWYKRITPIAKSASPACKVDKVHFIPLPAASRIRSNLTESEIAKVFDDANQVIQRNFLAFGAVLRPLSFSAPQVQLHWSEVSDHAVDGSDIKDIWEPARFGWAVHLLRAFQLSDDEKYAQTFWEIFEEFETHNPPNLGPNWASSQEVALRLVTLIIALSVFSRANASTPERKASLISSIYNHAKRIPPTLIYARAQRNNHLLSEALGLYAAGTVLNGMDIAHRWRLQGKTIFEKAILDQMNRDGEYIQNSLIYHRLALQLALWMDVFLRINQDSWSPAVQNRLARAADWLANLMDETSGAGPNYGHNDGSNFLALHSGDYRDLRPVVQASSLIFRHTRRLGPGAWDELLCWLGQDPAQASIEKIPPATPRLQHPELNSWVLMHARKFLARPAHADQLHVDLWLNGQNIVCDAGTYRYTALPPWDNSLANALVHNSIIVNQQEAMQRTGRFRWSQWDQAKMIHASQSEISAERFGYLPQGVLHRRTVKAAPYGWEIQDHLLPSRSLSKPYDICLQWLVPDQNFQVVKDHGQIAIAFSDYTLEIALPESGYTLNLYRAGEAITRDAPIQPCLGWISPTYAQKQPALSIVAQTTSHLPTTILTRWIISKI